MYLLGSTPAPATGGFGAATGGFGQPAAATATTGGFGGFGQKPATTGGFGATTGGFGQPAATGGFGQATGGFGQTAVSKPATSFSFGASAPAPATGGFGGGFGTSAAPAAGGFGQAATSTGGGLFGAAKPAAPTTSLFGNTAGATLGGTTGGFGGFGTGQTQAAGTSLFGQKPATGLGGGLFGGNNTLGGNTTGGFGGFGQTAGGTGQYQLPATGGLTSFGTNPLQQQPSLVATVDKNPYGNNPLFDLSKAPNNATKTGASAVALDGGKRKPSHHNYPIAPRLVSKIKLRGFSHTSGKPSQGIKKTASTSSLDGISDDAVLGAGAYVPRASNKNLLFDQNTDTANIVALVNDSKKTEKRRVVFNPNLELVAHQNNNTNEKDTVETKGTESSSSKVTPSNITTTTTITTTKTTTANVAPKLNSASASSVAIKNGYYISPTMETLTGMSKENLKHVQNLTVGRKGYGEVKFEVPVDLSEVVLDDIMGNIVVIEDKKIVVYPQEETKPAQGTKLNMPALVRIDNCFSIDKNTGAPIKDPKHPRFQLFKERLCKRGQVTFVSYDDQTGAWHFKVEGF